MDLLGDLSTTSRGDDHTIVVVDLFKNMVVMISYRNMV
jgi:hypothetical protein